MPPRRSKLFPTPDDAEGAFYEAFERGDLAAMMSVWAERDDVVCVHPQGSRLLGPEAVREGWMRIFAAGVRLRIAATEVRRYQGRSFAVHAVVEVLSPADDPRATSSVCATNVYELTANGWRMVLHHATASASRAPAAPAETPPHMLH